ncbi:MAG: hypothetical protein LBC07_04050 [Elusimicrobiota bacterium]|nr:hypothetical protein [Elusimicrobiota bacterium]
MPYMADDAFPRSLEGIKSFGSMIAFLKMYFYTLGQKLIVHAVYLIVLKYRLLFLLIGPLTVALTAYTINFLINSKNVKPISWGICLLFFIFPFWDLQTSGYVLDTVIYFLPFCAMLISFIPLKNIIEGNPYSKNIWQTIIFVLALIYACNVEQILVMIFPVLVFFLIFYEGRGKTFIWLQFMICCLSALYTVLTPGLYVRMSGETYIWFRDFASLSIFKLLELGFSSTAYHYIFKPNSIFLLFYILLALVVWRQKNLAAQISIIFIAITILAFGYIFDIARNSMTVYGYIAPYYFSSYNYLFLFLLIIVCIALGYLIYRAFYGSRQKLLTAFAILFLGILSRGLLMFSPTIWGSQTRTFFFLNFALLFLCIMLFQVLQNYKFNKKAFYIFVIALAFINTFLFIIHILNILQEGIFIFSKLKVFIDSYLMPRYDLVGWEMAVQSIQKG